MDDIGEIPTTYFGIYVYLSWACACMIILFLGRGTAFLDLDVIDVYLHTVTY